MSDEIFQVLKKLSGTEPKVVPGLEIASFDIYKKALKDREEYDALPDAELVVLHPPTPTWFRENQKIFPVKKYQNWLSKVIRHSWQLVDQGGYLALIVVLEESVSDVASMTKTLLAVAKEDAKQAEGIVPDVKLKGHHIAVSRDGREGWHILTIQRPDYEPKEANPKAAQGDGQQPAQKGCKLKPPQTPS